ncbi:BamA/TamA family outer membrane protein [Chamaesiphon minutus]|uniref:Outer membrane protein/protective antigen OMA87 n=1 Tax=Chamaesiphon minutus (strain ATCC 27169 / PCC 6605) TaxID=1173020 RepID=K9U9S3_CHAP6|nr:BamA/TamA family outer membrane protein [Chamaesiphon minutus]AFY91832.1 outer membrane protein/protective antigen OMA87 [Chamaesiphon minutus PCC 6605]
MKLKFNLLLVTTVATIGHISQLPAHAESTRIDRLVSQNSLASTVVEKKSLGVTDNLPTAKDLLAQSRSKTRKPTPRSKPVKKPSAGTTKPNATTPQSQAPTTLPAKGQTQVLVSDIIIKSPTGALAPELESRVRQVLTVKPGQPTTREQLEQNLNAIKALGAFSAVEIVPEDTSKGVRLSFLVTPYGGLRQVQIRTLPANSTTVIKQADIDSIFGSQYGKPLNAVELQAAIKQLNEFYQKQGYNLAQVVDVQELNADGTLTLVIAEGLIEDVQVRFINKEGSLVDDKKEPIRGNTRPFIVTREAELKPGKIFNRATAEKDLRRIFGLGIFDDVRVSFAPGSDPAKVILQFNVIERKTSSILAGGGISSTNGLFGSISYNQLNVGGNAQKLGAELQIGTRDTLYDLNFSDPWIATDPNRTSYNVNVFQRRSYSLVYGGGKTPAFVPGTTDTPTIVRQGGGITFSRPLNGDPFSDSAWRASLGVQYQKVSVRDINGSAIVPVDSRGGQLSFSGTGEDDLLMVQLGLTQDLRNSFSDPTQGTLLKLGLDQSVPIGNANILMTRARASFTNYTPVKLINFTPGSQALVFNIQGGTVLGDLPPYEAFSLGGTSSVRGYEDGDVGSGRSYIQATAEYRFPLISIVGGSFFADYGSDLGTGSSVPGNPAGVRSKPGNGFGYGAGIRINSPIGPIRIDYALNNINETRIQFGIGERF